MKFKVGDKVKIIRNKCDSTISCGRICEFYHKIGTITGISGKDISIKNFSNTDPKWCSGFKEYMLEFADSSKNIKIIKPYPIVAFLEKR